MSVRKHTLPSGQTHWQVCYRDQGRKRRSKLFETKGEAVAFEGRGRFRAERKLHHVEVEWPWMGRC
jgi:hypothetical protein